MSIRSEILNLLRQRLGEDQYRNLINSVGGEDKLWRSLINSAGGEYKLWEQIKNLPTGKDYSLKKKKDAINFDLVALCLTILTILFFGIAFSINAYKIQGWGGVFYAVIGTVIYGTVLAGPILQIFRHYGKIAAGITGLVITGLILYGLFKAGVFVAGSTGSFFKWLFGHFF